MTFLFASAWTRTAMVWVFLSVSMLSGCTLVPETRQRDTLHNPFPQMKRVAVLPFYNQSDQPNVDGDAVARSYYAALQAIPGFEVLPVGVTSTQYRGYSMQYGEPRVGADFQRLAQMMDVEAIVVGSVTDFDAYYPPRMGMTVHWYAANEGFHAIPPGYGLPWGTEAEEKIPARIVREAEFELARSQLKTQTPQGMPAAMPVDKATENVATPEPDFAHSNPLRKEADVFGEEDSPSETVSGGVVRLVDHHSSQAEVAKHQVGSPIMAPGIDGDVVVREDGPALEDGSSWQGEGFADGNFVDAGGMVLEEACGSEPFASMAPLPPAWPDPTDLIPDPPAMAPPAMIIQHDPVISHTRLYRGDDPYFTQRLADYVETGDDARGMAWQGYIKRSDDFIRFCCHLHIVEMLESRGGRDQSDLILRWPVSRY